MLTPTEMINGLANVQIAVIIMLLLFGDIIRKTSLSPGRLSGILLQLELSGLVQQTPGKLFCLAPNKNI